MILIAGAGQRGDAARCRAIGIAAYLTRPFEPADVFNAILQSFAPHPDGALITRHSLRERQRNLHVLVAEDDPQMRAMTVELLERLGHSAHGVATGREAVDASAAARFDLILMDTQGGDRGPGGHRPDSQARSARRTPHADHRARWRIPGGGWRSLPRRRHERPCGQAAARRGIRSHARCGGKRQHHRHARGHRDCRPQRGPEDLCPRRGHRISRRRHRATGRTGHHVSGDRGAIEAEAAPEHFRRRLRGCLCYGEHDQRDRSAALPRAWPLARQTASSGFAARAGPAAGGRAARTRAGVEPTRRCAANRDRQ